MVWKQQLGVGWGRAFASWTVHFSLEMTPWSSSPRRQICLETRSEMKIWPWLASPDLRGLRSAKGTCKSFQAESKRQRPQIYLHEGHLVLCQKSWWAPPLQLWALPWNSATSCPSQMLRKKQDQTCAKQIPAHPRLPEQPGMQSTEHLCPQRDVNKCIPKVKFGDPKNMGNAPAKLQWPTLTEALRIPQ